MAPKRSNRSIKQKPVKQAAIATPTYPPCILLDLPTELLVKILTNLPIKSLFSVRWTCRTLKDIIASTACLQYIIRAYINGVEDSLPPDFPHSKRLEFLRHHEQSRSGLQFDLFIEYVANMSYHGHIIIQDGYLIYDHQWADSQQYRYTDLYSAARNEELRWVHITTDHSPLPHNFTFAVDHNLVVRFSQQLLEDEKAVLVQLTFFEFTTGSFHPLSSIHTVSFPPLYGYGYISVGVEVLGDYILVFLWGPGYGDSFYLVSWKAGTVIPVYGTGPRTAIFQCGKFKTLDISENVVLLMKDSGNCLEVLKLEITSPNPCLQTICFLGLPPLMPGVSVDLSWNLEEWVPTSKNYAQSRSSRASHTRFYSSTVGTIAAFLDYRIPGQKCRVHRYALIIDVEALLYTIRKGAPNVPWAIWGSSSTHLFKTILLYPAGPSWMTSLSPLVLRQYYPRRTRYTQSMLADVSSSSRAGPQVFSSTEVSDKLWDECSIETKLPYRNVVASDLNLVQMDYFHRILADREWVVGISMASEGSSVRITVYHLV